MHGQHTRHKQLQLLKLRLHFGHLLRRHLHINTSTQRQHTRHKQRWPAGGGQWVLLLLKLQLQLGRLHLRSNNRGPRPSNQQHTT
jgi:hypothetical protein